MNKVFWEADKIVIKCSQEAEKEQTRNRLSYLTCTEETVKFIEWRKMEYFKFIDLFAGIGGIRLAFESVGGECVFSSEWENFAQDTYEANFGERPHGDITKIPPETIPDHDILLGGFPCQAFSICGEQKGFSDTRGTLFFNIETILLAKKPFAFMLENVKNLKSHDKGKTFRTIIKHLENLGYHVHHTVLNSLDFGIPQKRERTIIVGFKENLKFSFPKPIGLKPNLLDILEKDEDVDRKYFVSDRIRKKRFEKVKPNYPVPSIWHENKSGNISALEYSCALRAGASYNYLLVNGLRRLTPRELLRLQGFSDSFKIVVPYTQIRKQAGNSVSVPVIKAVAKEMIKSINNKVIAEPQLTQMEIWEKLETHQRSGETSYVCNSWEGSVRQARSFKTTYLKKMQCLQFCSKN